MAHQLGRTELEKLAPPLRGYCFGRTGLSFGRKKWLAPPKKCPKNAYEICKCHWLLEQMKTSCPYYNVKLS